MLRVSYGILPSFHVVVKNFRTWHWNYVEMVNFCVYHLTWNHVWIHFCHFQLLVKCWSFCWVSFPQCYSRNLLHCNHLCHISVILFCQVKIKGAEWLILLKMQVNRSTLNEFRLLIDAHVLVILIVFPPVIEIKLISLKHE